MKFHFLCSRRAILQNDDILSSSPISNLFINDFWGTPLSHSGSHKSYRPLCSLTFRLNALISGLNPYSFHLVNVSLHAISTYLVAAFAKTVFSRKSTVFLAALIFALHPIHTGTTWDSFAVLPTCQCLQSWLHWQCSLHKINIEVFFSDTYFNVMFQFFRGCGRSRWKSRHFGRRVFPFGLVGLQQAFANSGQETVVGDLRLC